MDHSRSQSAPSPNLEQSELSLAGPTADAKPTSHTEAARKPPCSQEATDAGEGPRVPEGAPADTGRSSSSRSCKSRRAALDRGATPVIFSTPRLKLLTRLLGHGRGRERIKSLRIHFLKNGRQHCKRLDAATADTSCDFSWKQ